MFENKWAAIVYGRTYEVDFRFITVPHDFDDERVNWARKYINSTTRYPQNLPQHPCWSFFQDDRHCVVGVTCMLKELLGNFQEENSEDLTKDMYGRDLFVFVGYVAHTPHPLMPSTKLKLFKEVYESYVRPRWNDKSYEIRNLENEGKNSSRYDKSFDLDVCIKPPENLPSYFFNEDNEIRFIWSVNANQNLWYKASQESKSLSICLGLFRKKYFLYGEFLNGTALDVIGDDNHLLPEKLQKEKEVLPIKIEQLENQQADRDSQVTSSSKSIKVSQGTNQYPEDNPTKQNKQKISSNKINEESQNSIDFMTNEPEFDKNQLIDIEKVVEEVAQFVQKGIGSWSQFLSWVKEGKDKIEKAKSNIKALKDNINTSQTSRYDSSSEQLNKIESKLKEVIQRFTNFCRLSDQSNISSHRDLNQEEKHQAEIESQNIDFDYGFKEKSDKNESKQKKWF